MKPRNQVHRNGATKPASLQRKTRIRKPAKDEPLALPKADGLDRCLCLYDLRTRKPVEKIPLSETELFNILRLGLECENHGKTSFEIIADAIREKFQGSKLRDAIEEVDSAKNDAFALLHLLRAHSENQAQCRQRDKDFDAQMNAGIGQLVNQTADFLVQSVKGLFYALPNGKPVAQ